MIELHLNKIKIKIPSEYKEVPLSLGTEVLQFVHDTSLNKNDKIAVIASLARLEPEIFYSMTADTIDNIYEHINFIKGEDREIFYYPTFTLDGITYGQIDFSKTTFREFADMDFHISECEYPLENLAKIMAILFRPIKKKKQSLKFVLINILTSIFYKNFVPKRFKSYEIEDYKEENLKRIEIFSKKLDMGFAIAAFQLMLKERQNIMDDFPTIFKGDVESNDPEQFDAPDPSKKQSKSFEQVWGLYHCLCSISGSLQERELWATKNVREFFVYLSYYNQRTQVENERAKALNSNQWQ